MSIRLDTPGQTEDTLEKLYISRLAWERLGVLPEELVEVVEVSGFPCSSDLDPDKRQKVMSAVAEQ